MALIYENIFNELLDAIKVVQRVADMDCDLNPEDPYVCAFCDADLEVWSQEFQRLVAQDHVDGCVWMVAKRLVSASMHPIRGI